MKRLNLNELGCFVTVYFGQDYDLIDDSDEIDPKIDAFLNDAHTARKHGRIADIDLLTEESADLKAPSGNTLVMSLHLSCGEPRLPIFFEKLGRKRCFHYM